MTQRNHVRKTSPRQTSSNTTEKPFYTIKNFFGKLTLPSSEEDFNNLQQAFVDLDLYQLNHKELVYLSNLLDQLGNCYKAVHLIKAYRIKHTNYPDRSFRKV
jgi:hypothetical protein